MKFIVNPLYKNESFLQQKYLIEMLSTGEIAKLAFSSKSTVSFYLKKFGIPIRAADESRKLGCGQLAYGEARVSGKVRVDEGEMANIRKMQELRGLGYSYQKIADIFNTMGIKTKNGKKWYITSIENTLKRNSK